MTKLVHCKKEKYDVYIGRPSKWGNPFVIGRDGSREEVIEKYRQWILQQPKLLNDLKELENKVLGCWCYPNNCHGDILISLIHSNKNKTKYEKGENDEIISNNTLRKRTMGSIHSSIPHP